MEPIKAEILVSVIAGAMTRYKKYIEDGPDAEEPKPEESFFLYQNDPVFQKIAHSMALSVVAIVEGKITVDEESKEIRIEQKGD